MIENNNYEWETALDYFNADERFGEVNFYNCWLGTPNFGEFLMHDVVFAGGGARYHDPVLFGDRLADTILRDGAVELAHFADTGGVAVSMANAACYPAGYSDVQVTSWGFIKAEFD